MHDTLTTLIFLEETMYSLHNSINSYKCECLFPIFKGDEQSRREVVADESSKSSW